MEEAPEAKERVLVWPLTCEGLWSFLAGGLNKIKSLFWGQKRATHYPDCVCLCVCEYRMTLGPRSGAFICRNSTCFCGEFGPLNSMLSRTSRRQQKKKSTVGTCTVSVSRSVDVNEGNVCFWCFRSDVFLCDDDDDDDDAPVCFGLFGSMFLPINRIIPFFLWKWSILCVKITPHPLIPCNIVYSRMIAVERFCWSLLFLSLTFFLLGEADYRLREPFFILSDQQKRVCVVFGLYRNVF